MNDDYLWDRSGDPNEDVQALEELLGTLRYQPRELEIPADFPIGRRRNLYRTLAIAAAVGFAVLGLGIWMSLQKPKAPQVAKSETSSEVRPTAIAAVTPGNNESVKPAPLSHKSEITQRRPRPVSSAAKSRRVIHQSGTGSTLSPSEIAAAETAKQQLMLALRVTSAKLTLVQKRTQHPLPANLIRNQHKIG